jgi:hypothetical protein
MNQRPLNRKLLASFIEYAVKGVVTPIEWSRFITTYYPDSVMEHARRECARILQALPVQASFLQQTGIIYIN